MTLAILSLPAIPCGLKTHCPGSAKAPNEVLQRYFGDKLFSSASKPTLVVTYDVQARKSYVIKSKTSGDITALDAVDASSAAPLYFPTVKVGQRWLIDGGVIANNPAMCVYAEAKKLSDPDEEIRMLSVGTGRTIRKIPGKESQGYGAVDWIRHDLMGVVMDETVVEYQAETLLGDNYLRINSPLIDASDDMDDCTHQNLGHLKDLGDRWFEENKAKIRTLLTV